MKFDTHYKQSKNHITNHSLQSLQLENDTSNIVSSLENDVIEQVKYLNEVTYDELAHTEQPFLGVVMSEDENYKYEVTITINSPNLFLLVDKDGGFKVEGHSSFYPTVTMGGHNEELLSYINTISSVEE